LPKSLMICSKSVHGATWRSGYATVCKTVYTSSILVVASTPNQLILQIYFVRRRFRPGSMIPARKWLPASWRILKKSVR
jgi:hypothetical protein